MCGGSSRSPSFLSRLVSDLLGHQRDEQGIYGARGLMRGHGRRPASAQAGDGGEAAGDGHGVTGVVTSANTTTTIATTSATATSAMASDASCALSREGNSGTGGRYTPFGMNI